MRNKITFIVICLSFLPVLNLFSQENQINNEKIEPKESDIEYRTTDWDSRLLVSPNSNTMLTRIPENTTLIILDKKGVQQGRMQNVWYKVQYNGYTGWTSGWNMKEEEKLIICTTEEMELNYIKQIGEKPQNNPLTGKINIINEWIIDNTYDPKSIKYIQWYKPYILSNSWNCRVEYSANNILGKEIKSNKVFQIKNNKIINVFDLH